MKSARLLSTVAAAALLLTAGAASAQTMKQDQSPGAAAPPAAQQKAPAEKTAPAMKPGDQKSGLIPPQTTGQAPKSPDVDKKPVEKSESPAANKNKDAVEHKTAPNNNAEKSKTEKGPTAQNAPAAPSGPAVKSTETPKAGASGSSTQSTETPKAGASGTATTGQGPASAAKLSPEQRTKITTVIRQQKVERIEPSKLNISISVGARIPTTVRFHPLPAEVFVVYPEWRGYDYILVGDEILVIDPRTHEIVAILEA